MNLFVLKIKKVISAFIVISLLLLQSCKGIKFSNQKTTEADELSFGEAMVFVVEEKNKLESRFGKEIWNLRSGDGKLFFKDYTINNVKMFVEKLMQLKLIANELSISLNKTDTEKLSEAASEYYASLSANDLEYMESTYKDIYNAFYDYHISRLTIDNLSKSATSELSISEAKVIKVQYMVSEDKAVLEDTIEKLKVRGASFAYFAKNKGKNTDIEMIIKRGDDMSVKFPELFYLSSGQVSSVLQSGNEYYLFKCLNDYMVKETEDRRVEILKTMKNNSFQENFERFKSKYELYSNAPYWKNINLQEGNDCTIYAFDEVYYKYFPSSIK